MAAAINAAFGAVAFPVDAGRVAVNLPSGYESSPATFISRIEVLSLQPDTAARVVVNERTGTVVMGGDVRIGTVAVAHGNLTVRVSENPEVVQPAPFSRGTTAVQPRTDINPEEQSAQFVTLKSTSTVEELVDALNSVGASARRHQYPCHKEAGALGRAGGCRWPKLCRSSDRGDRQAGGVQGE
ncbi:MAG: flagellar basal body P-ring protein FlgI [Dehalococcoidia bacterium]|nr:flagellar basal body P-ring protein FlgI [Dehalococcoidia bacterium]